MTIRVLVVDDHDVVRRGMRIFLGSLDDVVLIGEASDGEEGVLMCKEHAPDVILMDVMMPVMDGIKATQAITRENPAVRVVALTSQRDESMVQAMYGAGAVGYLLKSASVDELADTIRWAGNHLVS